MERQYRLEGGGSLTVRADGLRAAVEAERPADGRGLYKAYLRGPSGRALLGTLAPEGGRLRIRRTLTLDVLERELTGIDAWSRPRGGYFICFRAPRGCASRIVALCAQAGVTLSPAGAAFPGGVDPEDSVIRIAPSYPPLEELAQVMELFPLAVKLAALEAGYPLPD